MLAMVSYGANEGDIPTMEAMEVYDAGEGGVRSRRWRCMVLTKKAYDAGAEG